MLSVIDDVLHAFVKYISEISTVTGRPFRRLEHVACRAATWPHVVTARDARTIPDDYSQRADDIDDRDITVMDDDGDGDDGDGNDHEDGDRDGDNYHGNNDDYDGDHVDGDRDDDDDYVVPKLFLQIGILSPG